MFVSDGSITITLSLIQIMPLHLIGDMPFSETTVAQLIDAYMSDIAFMSLRKIWWKFTRMMNAN